MRGIPAREDYESYHVGYVSLVEGDDILAVLAAQLDSTLGMLGPISEQRGDYRYAPDKWSIKELLGHVIDTERIFAYRALRIARGDTTPLAPFDQDPYVTNAGFGACRLADLKTEFELVRRSNLAMFRHFSEDAWRRRGIVNGSNVGVLALAFITAGHVTHHANILRSRYL